jgi:hypothetical protein
MFCKKNQFAVMAQGTFKGAFIFIGNRPLLSEEEHFADAGR